MNKILEVKNLSMTYHTLEDEIEVLNNISFDVYEGEIVIIVGPSGCGKSTLLSIISNLIQPSSGKVEINKKTGYMFQKDYLFEWRNILNNTLIGLEIQNKITKESISYVKKLLYTYGLGDFMYNYPRQLSGGMRQRVALIRTLAIRPEFLLLDEPFSALDYQTRLAIADEIGIILKKENKTALMVTHDISEAVSMADRIIVLSNRPAYIKDIISIKLTCPNNQKSPIISREAPEFKYYFNKIWKELDVYVK